jgi:hypothetical protein
MLHGCPPSKMLGAGTKPGSRFTIVRGTATSFAKGSGRGHYSISTARAYRLKQSKARRRREADPPIPKQAKSSVLPGRPRPPTPELAWFCSAPMAGFYSDALLSPRRDLGDECDWRSPRPNFPVQGRMLSRPTSRAASIPRPPAGSESTGNRAKSINRSPRLGSNAGNNVPLSDILKSSYIG